MNPLPPCGVAAWSFLSCQGRNNWVRDGSAPSSNLEEILARPGLASHQAELNIPGMSGWVRDELPALPHELSHHDSRCARLLLETLEPISNKLKEACQEYGAARVGLVLGSSTGGIDATEAALAEQRRTGRLPEDYNFVDRHPYHALLRVATTVLGLEGPGFVISTACSSSGKAFASAQRLLSAGIVDAVLVGGVDALCEMTVRGFAGLGVLSETACCPFDAERTGISIGEGAALVLLDRKLDGPLFLLGAGESSDAHHPTAPHPEGVGASMAIRACLAVAGISPEHVSYLNAHGTGTVKNDDMEAKAIQSAVGDRVPFSSTKDRTGHQLGAAGGTEAVFCLEALLEKTAPANHKPARMDENLVRQPSVEPISLPEGAIALSNSFAFGGSNVSIAVGRTHPGTAVEKHRPSFAPVWARGVGLWCQQANNLSDWLAQSSSGEVLPAATLLPPRTRGRASLLTRAFAEIYGQLILRGKALGLDLGQVPSIYSSTYGEMVTTYELLEQIGHDDRLSPIRFQSSVHNTASGSISLATKNQSFSTAIAAGEESFAMALFEAMGWLNAHGGEILVLVADEGIPEALTRKPSFAPLAVGLLLAATPGQGPLGRLELPRLVSRVDSPGISHEPWRRERHTSLNSTPAAWGLELIEALSERRSGVIRVAPEYELETNAYSTSHNLEGPHRRSPASG